MVAITARKGIMDKETMKHTRPDIHRNRFRLRFPGARGFTLTEVLIALVIIAVTGVVFMTIQSMAFGRTKTSNRTLDAGQLIEKRIELMRMKIAANPSSAFSDVCTPPNCPGTLPKKEAEYSENGINMLCSLKCAKDPNNNVICNVREYKVLATWSNPKRGDTLIVTTYLAKNF
jgi:prepilin-type N-terminal cleavage/methylation domain-containing protein